MATTGPILGRDWQLHWNATQIDDLLSVSLSTSMGTIDITSYDSTSFRAIIDGIKEWSITATFLKQDDATEGYDEILADWNTSASGTALITTGVTGDSTFSGTAYVTGLEVSGELEGIVECSLTLQGTGAPTISTVGA